MSHERPIRSTLFCGNHKKSVNGLTHRLKEKVIAFSSMVIVIPVCGSAAVKAKFDHPESHGGNRASFFHE